MPEALSTSARPGAILIATVVSIVAIAGLVTTTRPSTAGALSLQDQAAYEIGLMAYDTCNPDVNHVITSDVDWNACCTSQCFTPCLKSGIQDCLETCKTICSERPVYRAGGSR